MATQYTAGITQGQAWTADIANQIGAAWETWTPTVTQPGTVGATNNGSRYGRVQKIVVAQTYLTITGAGAGGNNIIVTLPVNANNTDRICAQGFIYDASAAQIYVVTGLVNSATNAIFYVTNASASPFGTSPNVALAASDQIRLQFMYEAA